MLFHLGIRRGNINYRFRATNRGDYPRANLPGAGAQTVEELAHAYLRVRYASDMNGRGTLVRKLGAFRAPRAQRSDA